ncbi:MAG TPA: IPT/TIG domain-containing protein [Terriglobales bacterium]|nr:IPT/TIG domain-containing protein [Terriglobales bacterium]
MKLFSILLLAVIGVGCGYSKPANMPPAPGTVPTISQLSPPSTAAGSSSFSLEVDGTNFGSSAVVNFNGTAMSTQWVSASKVEASIPASAVSASGTVPVTVTNPGTPGGIYGGGTSPATSSPMNFTVN